MPEQQRATAMEILAAAVGSGGAISVALGWLVRLWGQRRLRSATRGYRDLAEVYRALHAVLADTRAGRVLLVQSANGGGRPAPGAVVYTDVLHEVYDGIALGSVLRAWRRRPVDAGYSALLERLAVSGFAHLIVEDMPQGELRTHCEAESVTQKYVHRVAVLPRAMIFLSAAWTEGVEVEPRELASIQAAGARIAEILRRNRAVVG